MTNVNAKPSALRERILRVIAQNTAPPIPHVADHEDVFAKLGLNSMQTFAAIIRLEKEFSILIGADPSDFDRMRTAIGLHGLVAEKTSAGATRPE